MPVSGYALEGGANNHLPAGSGIPTGIPHPRVIIHPLLAVVIQNAVL
jgi:hypothetical protein